MPPRMKITKTGIKLAPAPTRSVTRGQGDLATKASIRGYRRGEDLKQTVAHLFAAIGEKESMDEKMWRGFNHEWQKNVKAWKRQNTN